MTSPAGVDGATVLAWSDRDDARRRGGRPSPRWWLALAVGLGAAGLAAYRGGWRTGVAAPPSPAFALMIAVVGFVPAMLAIPHQLFWRADAAMLARLPIPGPALWRAALVRAARTAAAAALVVAPTVTLAALAEPAYGGRLAALVVALAVATAALVPAVCVGAAHVVASGQAAAASAALGGGAAVPTTSLLGALPGATIAAVVVAALALHPWLADGLGPRGPAILIGVVAVAALAAALAGATAARVLPRAMREVAALDRQILAHLEIQPITGLERVVRDRLAADAAIGFDRMARLIRRRYPLFALAGAAGAVALLGLGLGRPSGVEPWLAVVAGALAAVAATLAHATGRPPIELPRATALLPIAPTAIATARRALVGLWLAVWLAPAVVVAIAASPTPGSSAGHLGLGLAVGALVGGLRRPAA